MKKKFLNAAFLIVFLSAIIPTKNQAQETWDYSTPDYYYNYSYSPNHINGNVYRSTSSFHFGRSFDSEDYFSSGISSYQGTSTGPGPNGGYPGSAKGIYPTHYVDTSIYPNSYMQIQSRYTIYEN